MVPADRAGIVQPTVALSQVPDADQVVRQRSRARLDQLGGKCRACKVRISARYPIVEAITGGIFVFYYVMFFMLNIGPCATTRAGVMIRPMLALGPHWPIYVLYMFLIGALLAASLIDAELFIIPTEICWTLAVVGMFVHAVISSPGFPVR